jgi:predicted Holliday junction resolvase-like endonuclease
MTQSVPYLINQIIKQICLFNFLVIIFYFKSELLAFCRSCKIILFYFYILLCLLTPSIVLIKRSIEEISGNNDEPMGKSGDSSEEEEISEAEVRRIAKGKGKEVLPSTESHESSSSAVEDSSEVDKGQLLEDSDDL